MKIKIQHKESLQLADGEQLNLMIKELPTGEFEVSLKTAKNNSTINVDKRFINKTEALVSAEYLRSECHISKIKMSYEQLATDMKLAMDFAKEGVCSDININIENRHQDTLCLILNDWNEDKVIAALNSVGVYCRKLQRASQDIYYCLPFIQGSRTEIAELMDEYMRTLGYQTYVSYTLD